MRISDWSSDVCSSDLLNRDVLEASNIDYDESLVELIMATVDGIAFQAVIFKEGQQDRTGKQLDALKWAIASYGRNSMGDCSGRGTVRDDQCRRSEARRGGKEWASMCSSRWSPFH